MSLVPSFQFALRMPLSITTHYDITTSCLAALVYDDALVTLRSTAALQRDITVMPALPDEAMSAVQDQIHEAAEQKAQQEQDFKNSAETKTTIPAMWRPIA